MEGNALPCRVSAVLWDFDDTLVNSLTARVQALSRVFREVDIANVDPKQFILTLEHGTLEASLAHLADSRGTPLNLFER